MSRRRRTRPPAPLLVAGVAVAACDAGTGSEPAAWQVERDTIADTVVVRTTAGSDWEQPRRLAPEVRIGTAEGADEYILGRIGSLAVGPGGRIHVFDSQVPALRVYGPDGTFLRTVGRQGRGPGEYEQPDAGLAVLPDGRILLRDPGNARINVYSSSGETLGSWPIPGGHFTSTPLFANAAGHLYRYMWNLPGPSGPWRGLVEHSPEGEVLDTLPVPRWDYEAPTVSASTEGASQTWSVPFSPGSTWTWSPEGYFVGGLSTRYAIDVFRPDGSVLRIERRTEPVTVAAGEKAHEEERVRTAMRRLVPSWRWNGPPIPDVKPPFRQVYADGDGRIWVRLHAPGREEPVADPTHRSATGQPSPPPPWVEPLLFDLFEPQGRYLGQLRAPDGFQLSPRPVFGTEHVWAVVEDDLGVQSVVRFRIVEAGRQR